LVSSSVKAGLLGIVSLVIPVGVYTSSDFSYYSINWTIFGVSFGRGYSPYTFNLTQYATWDEGLSALTFVLVLVGIILLLSLRRMPKVGSSMLLGGLLAYSADIIYGEYAYGLAILIPLGLAVLLVAVVVGFRAKVLVSAMPSQAPVDSTEQLVKLKALLDSGAITKEEFEEQKKKILGEPL
jgi:uncharacterized membrane protein